ncbi:hypothetical protein BASA81_000653 [Batrachochytrium salamandrivorans]|nr:hypothetical protein BASA81_000653 [Batrachochytrium salamandrivorans]
MTVPSNSLLVHGDVQFNSAQDLAIIISNNKQEVEALRLALQRQCELAREAWEATPRRNARVELLRRQQSGILKLAALAYDEVGPNPRERRKFFSHRFIPVVWLAVFVYVVGTLAFCARWVLAYTSLRGVDNTYDANFVVSRWLLLSFIGVAVAFFMTEPVLAVVRFSIVPWVLHRFGTKTRFAIAPQTTLTVTDDAEVGTTTNNNKSTSPADFIAQVVDVLT